MLSSFSSQIKLRISNIKLIFEYIFTEGKCYMPVNLLLALDASGSIEPESWQSGIGLSKRIIRSFPIVNGGNEFGILDFSTNPRVYSNLLFCHQGILSHSGINGTQVVPPRSVISENVSF